MKHSGDMPVPDGNGDIIIELQGSSEHRSQGNTEEGAETNVKNAGQAYDMCSIRDAVESAPDMRDEKVARLKRMIASGEYKVNSREIADKMIREFLLDDTLKR